MIRRLVYSALAATLAAAGAAQAQPYQPEPYEAAPDPYALPPGYDQVTGYPPEYEGPAHYDAPAAEDYPDDRSGDAPAGEPVDRYTEDRYAEDRGYAADYSAAARDDSYYNSGASVRGSSTWSRQGYARSGETYFSRERRSSSEAWVEGEIDADGRVYERRDYVEAPDYVREYGYAREGEAYAEDRSAYSARYSSSSAPFGYQRRFYAFSVASEGTEELSVERSEEYAYARRDRIAAWANGDIRLDSSFQSSLTGGVEGMGPVMWATGGGGYASFSASASAYAGARAFAGVRGMRGHRGKGRGRRCGC